MIDVNMQNRGTDLDQLGWQAKFKEMHDVLAKIYGLDHGNGLDFP